MGSALAVGRPGSPRANALASGNTVHAEFQLSGHSQVLVGSFGAVPVTLGDISEVILRAESLRLGTILMAPGGVRGSNGFTCHAMLRPHIVVSPSFDAVAQTVLSGCGIVPLAIAEETGERLVAPPALMAEDLDAAVQRGLVLHSYLPACKGGESPRYRSYEPSERMPLLAPDRRNARTLVYAVCDDAFLLWSLDTDELLIALCRIEGRTALFVVPQRLAGSHLGEIHHAVLFEAFAMAARWRLPVVVLGTIQDGSLSGLASIVERAGSVPLVMVIDDEGQPAGQLHDMLKALPRAVSMNLENDVRDGIKAWLGVPALDGQ